MKKLLPFFLFLTLISLGGCQMNDQNEIREQVDENQENLLPKDMDPLDLPEEKVFQDEFTRSFLQSKEESRPDHYLFLSKNGVFEMDLHKDSKISESKGPYWIIPSFIGGKEWLYITIESTDYNFKHLLTIEYDKSLGEEQLVEEMHERYNKKYPTMESVDLASIFEYVEQENQTIYIGEPFEPSSIRSKDPETDLEEYSFTAYIFNDNGPGGITILYTSLCYKLCYQGREEDQAVIYDWLLNGIRFVN